MPEKQRSLNCFLVVLAKLALFRAHLKYGNLLFSAENSTETLASQANPARGIIVK